jgi:NAD(P)-dependent dehydrogenase (short-subunit alcohol dehydrogenase family)
LTQTHAFENYDPNHRALIIGASGGIGSAIAQALRDQCGAQNVVTRSRSADGLDITNEDSIRETCATLNGTFDLIFIATGALELNGQGPEKSINTMTPESLREQFEVNTLGPALLIKHLHPFLPRDNRCVLAVLTARVGSIGDNNLGGWISYRTAKAATHQIIRTSALEISRKRKQSICIALHPGTVETALTQKYATNHPTVTREVAAQNLLRVLDNLGPTDTGQFFDWAGNNVVW